MLKMNGLDAEFSLGLDEQKTRLIIQDFESAVIVQILLTKKVYFKHTLKRYTTRIIYIVFWMHCVYFPPIFIFYTYLPTYLETSKEEKGSLKDSFGLRRDLSHMSYLVVFLTWNKIKK